MSDKRRSRFRAVQTLSLEPHTVSEVDLEGVEFPARALQTNPHKRKGQRGGFVSGFKPDHDCLQPTDNKRSQTMASGMFPQIAETKRLALESAAADRANTTESFVCRPVRLCQIGDAQG